MLKIDLKYFSQKKKSVNCLPSPIVFPSQIGDYQIQILLLILVLSDSAAGLPSSLINKIEENPSLLIRLLFINLTKMKNTYVCLKLKWLLDESYTQKSSILLLLVDISMSVFRFHFIHISYHLREASFCQRCWFFLLIFNVFPTHSSKKSEITFPWDPPPPSSHFLTVGKKRVLVHKQIILFKTFGTSFSNHRKENWQNYCHSAMFIISILLFCEQFSEITFYWKKYF